jgi:isopenicillin-N N-acyltransferase-like protein
VTVIRVTRIEGAPDERGHRHGATHAEGIRAFCDERIALTAAGSGWDRPALVELAEQMLPAHEAYDGDLHAEMLAMAEAAGISPAEAVIVGGYTDFIDTVRAVAGRAPVEDNCTAVLVPDLLADGHGFLAQTWDMEASAIPFVILLDVRPDHGPASLVFTTMGTIGQIGLNEAGIAVGINNLTAADGRIGVTWPFVVRRALAQTTFDAAVAAVLDADLAGGHNFLVLDGEGNGVSIEAMPTATHVERLHADIVAHTNHCLVPATRAVEGPRPADLTASTTHRLAAAVELLPSRPVTVDDLMAMTRDERSICRHPTPPWDYASCGAAVMRPGTGELWACWGIPSENDYEHFQVMVGA